MWTSNRDSSTSGLLPRLLMLGLSLLYAQARDARDAHDYYYFVILGAPRSTPGVTFELLSQAVSL